MGADHRKVKKGLLILNIGNGKGRSTSAFAILLRAWDAANQRLAREADGVLIRAAGIPMVVK